jgi:hypothetical protein
MFQIDKMASVNAQKSVARQLLFDFPDRERTEEIVDAVEHKCIMSVALMALIVAIGYRSGV